mmetsp:Transcript_24708/g.72660  ORF Transcript_24708/g.72660 Transcript_24708/m.72660 type:complete len:146 (-) Transcript_24708:63-500(-)
MAKKKARRGTTGKVRLSNKTKNPKRVPRFVPRGDGEGVVSWNKEGTVAQNYAKLNIVMDVNKIAIDTNAGKDTPVELLVPPEREKFTPMPERTRAELRPLVRKYGDDVRKMARDRKVNKWQRTQAQLEKLLEHYRASLEHDGVPE